MGLKLTIFGKTVNALVDSGATHSFVSPELVDRLRLRLDSDFEPLTLTIANRDLVRIDSRVKEIYVRIGQFGFKASFLVAPIPYDALLGVDWLRGFKATTHWGSNVIWLRQGNFTFKGVMQEVEPTSTSGSAGYQPVDQRCAARLDGRPRGGPPR